MSDNELPPLPDECEAWWWPKTVVDGVNEWGRAVERAAYKRAERECAPYEDDDRIGRQIKREIAERIRALWRQHD